MYTETEIAKLMGTTTHRLPVFEFWAICHFPMTAALAAAAAPAGLPWLTAAMTGPGYLYEKIIVDLH